MAHNPVNHPARPIYRAVGGLTGLYLVIFGVLGVIETGGGEPLAQDDTIRVLGQGSNLGFSVLTIVVGLLVLAGIGIGRNIDAMINKAFAYVFMVLGLAELAVLRADVNVLNFTVATCVVTMIVGLVLLMAGMYGKIGSDEEARAWQDSRMLL